MACYLPVPIAFYLQVGLHLLSLVWNLSHCTMLNYDKLLIAQLLTTRLIAFSRRNLCVFL